ncbi:hypothetical protein [Eisenibacter elegans]|jgi:transcriptional antiterminator Rof (Rho-off)|uniref:hypothetical protein n=1 Tax=Eisenibacter elegans TaxID=997 RepID=UPI0005542EDF|nr:hypothetical protein [Eisenibacter elegans]
MIPQPYHPIDCNFYDILLDRATRVLTCHLVIQDFDGSQRELRSYIEDVYTQNHEEFLLLRNGQKLRLDQILSVDGIEPSHLGSCRLR